MKFRLKVIDKSWSIS